MNKHTREELKLYQSLPLEVKIRMTEERIRGWVKTFGEDGVYISFSGGKDSTVLMDIIRNRMKYDIPAVFIDTGLEYPEIREFVKTFDNVVWLKPEMNFKQIITKYGYPFISKEVSQCLHDVTIQSERKGCDKRKTTMWNRVFKIDSEYSKKYPCFSKAKYDFMNDAPFKFSHRCCDVMKKKPAKKYEKETGRKPIIATMASESRLRTTQWIEDGCNAFEVKRPTSKPISFWTEQDILNYISKYNINICSVYGDIMNNDGRFKCSGVDRTGCMFCGFGCHSKNDTRFINMKKTHPKIYDYIMRPEEAGGLNYKNVIVWLNEHGNLNIRY